MGSKVRPVDIGGKLVVVGELVSYFSKYSIDVAGASFDQFRTQRVELWFDAPKGLGYAFDRDDARSANMLDCTLSI